MSDLETVVAAARSLPISPRSKRWTHLSLCVLDAVFSIGARYSTTARTCHDYAGHAHLARPAAPVDEASSVIGTRDEQRLDEFVGDVQRIGVDRFAADVLHNRQRTSPRAGILKAEAALQYAEALVDSGVSTFADLAQLMADPKRADRLETRLRAVRGNGTGDVRLGYFWMLVGSDDLVKPDRMVLGWLEGSLGRRPEALEARNLLAGAAQQLACTPWALDHAIWNDQRTRRPRITSDTQVVARHRAHQGRWREDVLGVPAGASANKHVAVETVDSMLPEKHDNVAAAETGWNLMSDAARDYTRDRLTVVKQTGGVAEEDRLWRNVLSSQPLAFSIVGELRAYPAAALRVLSELSGLDLVQFDRLGNDGDNWALEGLQAEWAPPRDHHTDDRSGFDIAAATRLADGRRLLLTIEVKYVDSFSAKPLKFERYRSHLDAVGLDATTTDALVTSGGSQFLRSVLLTDSIRRHGVDSDGDRPEQVLAVVLGRRDDQRARRVVEQVGRSLTSAVPVAYWSHEQFLDAAARQPELADWAEAMWYRYVPSENSPARR